MKKNENKHIQKEKLYFDDLERTIVKDANTLKSILKETNTDFLYKKGFWLFAEEFNKDDAHLEFGESSPWDPTYFVYRDYDDNVVAMRSFRVKDLYINGYAHMIAMQVLDEYKGNGLSEDITEDTIKYIKQHYPNIIGVTLVPREPSLENLYKKYGYRVIINDGIRIMAREFRTNENSTMKTNILYPGAFAPVHDGHLSIIDKWLNVDNTQVCVIISNNTRQGISPYTTKWFLEQIFGQRRKLMIVITEHSPVRFAYNYTATKQFGDGIYTLVSSNKQNDIKRSVDFVNMFKINGRYYTPGVYVIDAPIERPILYTDRNDEFNESPISSTILRSDIISNNFDGFCSAYTQSIKKGLVNLKLIKEYYDKLRIEIIYPRLIEGGVAGHINHPYEDSILSFDDIKGMINDLFCGNISDITEKLDGINIYASIDEQGRTIFARNRTQLRNSPMFLSDIVNNVKWSDKIKESFIKGSVVIDKVFNNISQKVKFFNYNDNLDGLKYRTWCNIEIIDHDNTNVIPYADNFISFHSMSTTCEKTSPVYDGSDFSILDDVDTEHNMKIIEDAINKTSFNGFTAKMTPKVILKQNSLLDTKLQEYENELEDIIYQYKLNEHSTITDYKYAAFYEYMISHKNIFNNYFHLNEEGMKLLSSRWSGKEKVGLREFNKLSIDIIKKYESSDLNKLKKRIMLPIDKFFINLGNDIIKLCDGFLNTDRKNDTIDKIKKEIVKTIDIIEQKKDEKYIDKLEYLLVRLGDETELNATEGIVFKYHGRIYKLTGSFAVLNQILAIGKNKKEV